MLCPCAPSGLPHPKIISSTIDGSTSGFLSKSALTMWDVILSARVLLKPPRNDFARPVLTLSTITALRIYSPFNKNRASDVRSLKLIKQVKLKP